MARHRVISGSGGEVKITSPDTIEAGKLLRGAGGSFRVGIFGGGEIAERAVLHEFGLRKRGVPERSFLRLGLRTESGQVLNIIKRFLTGEINKQRAAQELENIIDDTFETSGHGTWPALKHRQGQPLVDTGRLRRSIKAVYVQLKGRRNADK